MSVHDAVLVKSNASAAGAAVQSIFELRGTAPDCAGVAMVGTYTPRKCGIATFGNDIVEKLAEFHPNIAVDIYALDDLSAPLAYSGIAGTIAFDDPRPISRPPGGSTRAGSTRSGCSTSMASSAAPTARWCATSSTGSRRR
jgi:hypothetical protein